jgi:hypothetical protein
MVIRTLDTDPEFTLNAVPQESGERPGVGGRVSAPRRSIRPAIAALAIVVLLMGLAALYFLGPHRDSLPPKIAPAPPPESTVAPPAPSEAAVAHPVEKIPTAATPDAHPAQAPLPSLDDSDSVAKDVIGAILGEDAVAKLLVPGSIIRHIVATIDNLPRTTLAPPINPVRPAPGTFATAATAHGMVAAEGNAQRYAVYVKAAESIDTQRLVGFYVRLYPLFQQAYVELGYPHGYFNDRLISVIDHLLAAPEPKPPVYLVQPKVRYQFADPGLEELSAGQKILVRIGIDNELRLKAKLREIRGALTAEAKRP